MNLSSGFGTSRRWGVEERRESEARLWNNIIVAGQLVHKQIILFFWILWYLSAFKDLLSVLNSFLTLNKYFCVTFCIHDFVFFFLKSAPPPIVYASGWIKIKFCPLNLVKILFQRQLLQRISQSELHGHHKMPVLRQLNANAHLNMCSSNQILREVRTENLKLHFNYLDLIFKSWGLGLWPSPKCHLGLVTRLCGVGGIRTGWGEVTQERGGWVGGSHFIVTNGNQLRRWARE